MKKVVIATKPKGFCINCTKSIILLKAQGVKPEQIEKTTVNADKLLKHNFKSYPVIMPHGKLDDKADFDGFQPRKLMQLARALKA